MHHRPNRIRAVSADTGRPWYPPPPCQLDTRPSTNGLASARAAAHSSRVGRQAGTQHPATPREEPTVQCLRRRYSAARACVVCCPSRRGWRRTCVDSIAIFWHRSEATDSIHQRSIGEVGDGRSVSVAPGTAGRPADGVHVRTTAPGQCRFPLAFTTFLTLCRWSASCVVATGDGWKWVILTLIMRFGGVNSWWLFVMASDAVFSVGLFELVFDWMELIGLLKQFLVFVEGFL